MARRQVALRVVVGAEAVQRRWQSGAMAAAKPATGAAAAAAQAAAAGPAATAGGDAVQRTKNPLGQESQALVHRGRGAYKVALGDLRQLLQKCQTKEDLKYGRGLVELFQLKGQDFSEEVNSHFVAMCIRAEQPEVAVKNFAVYKNRLGSWTTPKSFHNLTTAVLNQATGAAAGVAAGEEAAKEEGSVVQQLAAAVDTITRKGAHVSAESLALLLKLFSAGEQADAKAHGLVAASAVRVLGQEAATALVAANPAPVAAAAEAAPAPAAPAAAAPATA